MRIHHSAREGGGMLRRMNIALNNGDTSSACYEVIHYLDLLTLSPKKRTLFSVMQHEALPSVHTSESTERDLRERILGQNAELMRTANALANKIRSLPPDPTCPNIEPRAYLVGGFVRDAILGKHPKDADLEVYGVSQERLEELLDQLFEGRVNAVGKAFAVYKINLGDNLDLDVAMPRRESATGKGHKDIVVTGDPDMTPNEATRRRDFTINSLLADPLTGEIIDPFHGLEDLESHTLRAVDPTTFVEDPLRVYRALQFCARMNLHVEPNTKRLLQDMTNNGSLDHLSRERISEEISKLLLKSPKPSIGFELAKELGIIERSYPELAELERTPQEPAFHPEGNVWTHTMMVIDKASEISKDPFFEFSEQEREQLMLSALCHDLGKPETTKEIDGRIRSHGHEGAGQKPTESLLDKWQFGKETNKAVISATINHLAPFELVGNLRHGSMNKKQFKNAVRRLLNRIAPCSWSVLIALCESDSRGREGDESFVESNLKESKELREIMTQAVHELSSDAKWNKTLVNGKDVLEFGKGYGIQTGKIVGTLIGQIEDMRDRGEIETREEALIQLETLIKQEKETTPLE